MDIKTTHNWLKRHLTTKASPEEVAKYLSLSGPSVERIQKTADGDAVYSIEVTTNRIDCASAQGIAREMTAILPRYGIKTKLKSNDIKGKIEYQFKNKVDYLHVKLDKDLCQRFTAVLIKNVAIKDSPQEIKSLLEKIGLRSINNIVDISNFIMHDMGQPVHTFDYDKIEKHMMYMRNSVKNETITTLDDNTFSLRGNDIVIEDGQKRLIDLCGIMGAKNSAIDDTTKNVLLFVQNYNSSKVRKTSMYLNQRTEAVQFFEKGIDNENIKASILKAIDLIEKTSGGVAEKIILDIYPAKHKTKTILTTKETLEKVIGISISKKEISDFLKPLGFDIQWIGNRLKLSPPSWRTNDINIPEDIAEEIARIYGYQNIPSKLMSGEIPLKNIPNPFNFENLIRNILVSLGGVEIYNLSLRDSGQIKLTNPFGSDTAYLHDNLKESLIENVKENVSEKGNIHFFEISNCFFKDKTNLPKEVMTLSGITKGQTFAKNKGIIETLLEKLSIDYKLKIADRDDFKANQRLEVYSNNVYLGDFGNLNNDLFFYAFEVDKLANAKIKVIKFKNVTKYPPQVEDITLTIPEKTYIGNVISTIESTNHLINKVELTSVYENNYTFNIEYQSDDHTLTDGEVDDIRKDILKKLNNKFGIIGI